MRRSLPGINYELAAAMRRVLTRYLIVVPELRPDVTGERWDALEAEVDVRCGAGDRDGALLAIAAWEEHVAGVLAACVGARPDHEGAPRVDTANSSRAPGVRTGGQG